MSKINEEPLASYECPVCEFTLEMGAPRQEGVDGPVGTVTLHQVTHSGCGVAWPLRTSHAVLADEPKPKRKRWWQR